MNVDEANAVQSERLRWMTACEDKGLPWGAWRELQAEHYMARVRELEAENAKLREEQGVDEDDRTREYRLRQYLAVWLSVQKDGLGDLRTFLNEGVE